MADTFERLGIQLELEPLKGDPTQALATLKKTLGEIAEVMKGLNLDKLGNIKMDGISSELKKAKGSAKDVKDGLEQTAEAVAKVGERAKLAAQELQKVGSTWREFLTANKEVALAKVGGDWEQAQKLMSNFYRQWKSEAKSSSQQVEDDNKKVKSSLAETMKFEEDKNKQRAYIIRQQQQDEDKRHSLAIRNAEQEKAQWEKFHQFVERETQSTGRTQAIAFGMNEKATLSYNSYANRDADGAYKAYLKNLEDVKNKELKILTERGQQTLAIIRNTAAAEKAERDNAIKGWRDYIAALSAQGYKVVDGGSGYIKKTAVADVVTAQSMANAEQMKRVLSDLSKQSYDTKITAQQVGEAFKKAGIDVAHLDGISLNKLNSGIRQLGVSLDGTSGKFKEVTQKTTGWASAIDHTLKRLVEFYSIRQVIFAISSQFRDAISGAIDFNQNIHDIAAISGASTKEMQQLGDSILGIARNSRFTANEVAKLMQVLAQAGVAAKDMPTVSDAVGKFATATASDPKIAADVFTTSMNVFRLDAAQSTRVLNALTAALNNSKLETEGLATAFNYLAPQAAQFGYSLEQTLGIVAGMSQAGVKSSTIGTGVSQMLKEFAAPKERLKQMLAYYKISAEEINPISHTFVEIVDRLNDAGVKSEHLFQALESRVGRSVVAALQIGGEEFQNMTNSITGTNAGIVAFNKSMEGARAKLNVIKQELLTAVIGVGETLSPIISGFIEFVSTLVKGLNTIPGQIVLVTGALAGLGAALYTVGASASAFLAIAGIPVLPVVAAVAALTGALFLLGSAQDENATKSDNLIKSLTKTSEATQTVKDGVTKVVTSVERTHSAFKTLKNMSEEEREVARNSAEISKTTLNLKTSQKKSLYELASAYPQYFAQIDIEKLKYGQLLDILKKVNAERQQGEISAAKQYNENAEQIKKDTIVAKEYRDKIKVEGERGAANPFDLYFAKTTEKRIEALKEKQKSLRTALGQTTKYDPRTDNWTEKTEADIKKEKAEEEAAKRSPKDPLNFKRGNGSAAENNYAKSVVQELKDQAKELQAAIKINEEVIKDTEVSFEEREKAFEDAKAKLSQESSYNLYAEIIERTQKFVSANKIKGYDPNQHKEALLAGENISLHVDPNNKKYQEFAASVESLVSKSKVVYNKEIGKLSKEFLAVDKKFAEEYDKQSEKIQSEAFKRKVALLKNSVEFAFSQAGVDYTSAIEAYSLYIKTSEEAIDDKYNEQKSKLTESFMKRSPTEQVNLRPQYLIDIKASDEARADEKGKIRVEASNTAISKVESRVIKDNKAADVELAQAKQKLSLQKEQVWTADEQLRLEAKGIEYEIENTKAKERTNTEAYKRVESLKVEMATRLEMSVQELDKKAESNQLSEQDKANYDAINYKLQEYKQNLEELVSTKSVLVSKKNETADESFMGNFEQGLRKGTQSLGSFKSMTQELGSSVVTTFSGGMTNALTGMVDALGRGENAWKSFASTMGNMLKSIGDMLVKYVMQLMVVWAVQQLVGLVAGGSGGGTKLSDGTSMGGWTSPSTTSFSFLPKAEGGIIQHFANGGLSTLGGYIPTNVGIQGKDSVPAMLMPGEYVIKKDMVDLYGVDYLKALNQGKIQKFAEGGSVGGSSSSGASPKDNDGTPYSFSIINVADVNSIPPIDGQAVVNIVSFDAAKKGPTYHTIKGIMQNS